MARTRKQKEKEINDLVDKLKRAKLAVLTGYQGITVFEMQELRSKLRELEADYKVAKNTLLKIALKKAGLNLDISEYKIPLALAFSYKDEVSVPKEVYEFSKGSKALEILSGIMDEKLVSKDTIIKLATLPSKEELFSRIVYMLNYPLSGLVNILQGNTRKLVYVLKAISENK